MILTSKYIVTNGGFIDMDNKDELYHYGVLGMKWGVRRSNRLSSSNERLAKKALKYDKRAAILQKKSEKQHAKIDLETSNRAATKAANYTKKAAAIRKKALKGDDVAKLNAEKKASKLEFKAAKKEAQANRLSKTTGYGAKAMRYSVKSDKVAIRAAKTRSKMASNKAYISMMNRRLDSLDKEMLRRVEEPLINFKRDT